MTDSVAFGLDGNLYVVGTGNNGVLRYNGTTGAFIDNFIASGSGGLSSPQFMLSGYPLDSACPNI